MTYKEKWKADGHTMPNSGCPCDYAYEEPPKFSTHCASTTCEACWSREIEEKEQKPMKYKVGDTVLVQGNIIDMDYESQRYTVNIAGKRTAQFEDRELFELPKPDKTYEDGLQDAWELARDLEKMRQKDLLQILGYTYWDVLAKLTPQEALAKLEAYEESQKIKVGDVVEYSDSKVEIWITFANGDLLNGIKVSSDEWGRRGSTYSGIYVKDCKKTGKHIDIAGLLEQIKGE